MTSIDEVIARSRQPGGFSERRTFTLAKDRAIEKIRQFALADPHFYILELIQSAIANQATFIDITLEDTQVILSYIGGHYDQGKLEQLFDFLFASNANVEQGSLRLLALGVNALMLFEPDEIIVESGDGTLQGTTRVVIERRKGVVEVGTPERALKGTFMRATGLKRRGMDARSALARVGGRPREYTAIEERCIVAPVPVIVNGVPIFGYSRQRSPQLFGFSHTISFDEGDLYGTIGLAARQPSAVFRLVTHGVWAQTVGHDFVERLNTGYEEPLLGGVISFGGLRKTADHSGIVKDAGYDQMWQRLLPYLEQLRFGTQASRMGDILQVDGRFLSPVRALDLIREAEGVVILPVQKYSESGASIEHARLVGDLLSFPVLVVDAFQERFVRSIAGDAWSVIAVNVDDPQELSFYRQPKNDLPARPWFIEPVDCETVTMDEITGHIDEWIVGDFNDRSISHARKQFWGGTRGIKTTLYTQFDSERRDGGEEDQGWSDLRVWLQVSGRLVREVRLPAFFPGQVLVVEIPDMQPSRLRQSVKKGEPAMAVLIAQALVSMLGATLNRSVREAIQGAIQGIGAMDVAPGSLGARWIVAVLAQATMTKLNAELGKEASVSIVLVDRVLESALLDVQVFTTLGGDLLSVRDLAGLIQAGGGLVYGVVSEVEADLEGLDRSKILGLDLHLERLLVELLGAATYVRVDGRDVLAEYRGVQCRDIALGLRDYVDFPLLVEGADPTLWSEAEQRACVFELLKQLTTQVDSPRSDIPLENRRQALRHLQWFVVNCDRYPLGQEIEQLDDKALFLTNRGLSASNRVVREVQETTGELRMFDGLARDVLGDTAMFRLSLEQVAAGVERLDLAMNPYVFWLLSGRGPIYGLRGYGLLDVGSDALAEHDRGGEGGYLAEIELDDELFEGFLRIPLREGARGSGVDAGRSDEVLVVSEDRAHVMAVEEATYAYGVVGVLRLRKKQVDPGVVTEAVLAAGRELLERQVLRLSSGALIAGDTYEQVAQYLLRYAGQHLQISEQSDGRLGAQIVDGIASQILELPLFSARQGSPVSIRRLFYVFRNVYFANPSTSFEDLGWAHEVIAVEEISESMRTWLLESFHLGRVLPVVKRRRSAVMGTGKSGVQEASVGLVEVGLASGVMSDEEALVASIRHWLQVLRPDSGFNIGAVNGEDLPMRVLLGEHPLMKGRRGGKAEALLALDMPARWQALERNMRDTSFFPGMTVWMNPNHWMVRWALSDGLKEARQLAWLLLAVYAHINEALEAVKNVDEQVFQQRVYRALREGSLQWDRRS